MVGERIRSAIDRKPVWIRAQDRVKSRFSKLRNRPSDAVERAAPSLENRNFGGGQLAGTGLAGIAVILEDTLGIPFGASSDITNVEPVQDGQLYTVNVNAPTRVMSDARAAIDSTTGFTYLVTDNIEIRSIEKLDERIARDTWQIKLVVME